MRRNWIKPVILLVVLTGLVAGGYVFSLGEYFRSARGWIASLGTWGPLAFMVIYAVAAVAMVPGTALTGLAGGLFGSVLGVVYVSIASTVGAAVAFLIARYVARDAVREMLGRRGWFNRLDEATARHGGWIVAIARLTPLPYNLLNYAFGLTAVNFWTYVLLSWLFMLPGTILYVVSADTIVNALERGETPWGTAAIVLLSFAALTGAAVWAKRRLDTK